MKGYESMASGTSVGNARPMSKDDFKLMSASEKDCAVTKAVQATVLLASRIMSVDACIEIMRRRAPFASIDKAMQMMSNLCAELTSKCMEVMEFCVAENVLAAQDNESIDDDRQDFGQGMAADPPAKYGN